MSDNTPRIGLPELAQMQELDSAGINDALIQLDVFTDVFFKGQFVNPPPSSPADGDTYLIGGTPSGAWSGYAYKIAYCLDGAWRFYTPFDGMKAVVSGGAFIIYQGGSWTSFNPALVTAEVTLASAATCDIGAASSLCVAISGTTAITSLGSGVNCLRFVRFSGALLLTYNATSLVTPTGGNIQTAAGDACIAHSDAGGNWTIVSFTPAGGVKSSSVTSSAITTSWSAMTSLALTPGHWRINAGLFVGGGSAANEYAVMNVNTIAASASGTVAGKNYVVFPITTGTKIGAGTISAFDLVLSANTTCYLNAAVASVADTIQGGWLRAERIF